jgi:CheY-like chemotaxis protein
MDARGTLMGFTSRKRVSRTHLVKICPAGVKHCQTAFNGLQFRCKVRRHGCEFMRKPMAGAGFRTGSEERLRKTKMGLGKRILYIEDEPDLQWLVKRILESAGGFEVRACSSGAEGLRCLGEFAPDLVLLDVMMPGMDGFGVLRALRARPECAALPVVFLTARSQECDEYLLSGVRGVIGKPFEPASLVQQVRAYAGDLVAA